MKWYLYWSKSKPMHRCKTWNISINYQIHFCNPKVSFFLFYFFNSTQILTFHFGGNMNLRLTDIMKHYIQATLSNIMLLSLFYFSSWSLCDKKKKKLQVQVNNSLSKWTREMKILGKLCFHLNSLHEKVKINF